MSSRLASTSITAAGRNCAQVNSSARVQTRRTGLPAAFASRAASTAHSPECLPPNPPPKSGMITRTRSSVRPNARASSPRTPNGCWLAVQTVSLPSAHSATAARGSIGQCWT